MIPEKEFGTLMSNSAPWSGLASSVQRRLSARFRRVRVDGPTPELEPEPAPATEPPAQPAPPEPDPFDEEVKAFLRANITERYGHDEGSKFLENDLNHIRRYATSLKWIPGGAGRVVDPAAGTGVFPQLVRHFRGYEVEAPGFWDLEKDRAPYDDAVFDGVILMEVLEHFKVDPMFAMSELNRILRPGGFLFLTTPNIASWVSLYNAINWHTPYIYGMFERNHNPDRHNREYTVLECERLAQAAGFRVEKLEALNAYPDHDAVGPIPGINPYNRGDTTFLLARKEGPVVDRYPGWLYKDWGI